MAKHFYQCDLNSKVGRRLQKFWAKAVRACERADAYAKKYGASHYEPPVQFYAGGVDYLLFIDKRFDRQVWRKRMEDSEGNGIYEPNCMVRSDVLVLPDDRFHPSDTWNKTYGKDHLSWQQVKRQKTLAQWAAIIGYQLTDDREADAAAVELELSKRTFVAFLEYFGSEPVLSKAKCPQWLSKAIRAEKDRQALPVVDVEELFLLLGADVPTEEPQRTAFLHNMTTPTFFVYRDSYYVATQCPCVADGLHDITEGTYNYKQNIADRESQHEN